MFPLAKTEWAHNLALIDCKANKMTYGELANHSKHMSKYVAKRSLVLFMCDYDITTVSTYYSLLELKAVPLLISSKADYSYVEKLCSLYKPQYIWLKEEKLDEIKTITDGTTILCYDNHVLYKTQLERIDINPNIALLLTSSGSTGNPKTVILTYSNLFHNATAGAASLKLTTKDCGITTLPMEHCFGLFLLHSSWAIGAKICLYDETVLNPLFLKALEEQKPSFMFAVPYTIDLLKFINNDKLNKSLNMRFILIGGGRLNDNQFEFIKNLLQNKSTTCILGYGQTEGTGVISTNIAEEPIDLSCVGTPVAGLKVYIINKDSSGIGEIVLESDSVGFGYASSNEDLNKEEEFKGFLHTGDLGTVNNEGKIHLYGRQNRIVKLLSERYNLDDIEELLINQFKGSSFACVEVNSNLAIFHNSTITEKQLKETLRVNYKIPGNLLKIHYINDFPKTASGKIAYSKLEDYINKE